MGDYFKNLPRGKQSLVSDDDKDIIDGITNAIPTIEYEHHLQWYEHISVR